MMLDHSVGEIQGLLKAAELALDEAAKRTPASIVGSSGDEARKEIATAQLAITNARYHVAKL